jgi:hypothetical protein
MLPTLIPGMSMDSDAYIEQLQEFNKITSSEFLKALTLFNLRLADNQLPMDIAAKLQYLDILTQRIQHLIDTHKRVMTLYIDSLFKNSFLHLQYFQFSIIIFDLFEAVSVLETHLSHHEGGARESTSVFPNKQGMAAMASQIERSLLKHVGDTRWIGMPALTVMQTQLCRQFYTMESERVVLDWYLRNSTGHFGELLKAYQSWQRGSRNTAIELFDNG